MKVHFSLFSKVTALSLISVLSLGDVAVGRSVSDLHADQGSHPHHAMPSKSDTGSHEHGSIEVPATQPLPTVKLIAHPDARRGWNLEIQVTNFRFAPEQVNQPNSSISEGHAHLYVNGVKIARLYGNWYYLESLPPGSHELKVSLNTNTHDTLTHNGQPIQATVVVEAPNAP